MNRPAYMLACSDPEPWPGLLDGSPRRRLRWSVFYQHDPSDYMGGPGPARYAGPKRKVFTLGIAGPVGSGKTAMVEMLCRALWPEINLAVITNDVYTHEDAEFLS